MPQPPLPKSEFDQFGATIVLTRRTKSAPRIASQPTKALHLEAALEITAMASDTCTPARPHPIVAGWIAGRHKIRKEALANRIAMGDARARDPGEFYRN